MFFDNSIIRSGVPTIERPHYQLTMIERGMYLFVWHQGRAVGRGVSDSNQQSLKHKSKCGIPDTLDVNNSAPWPSVNAPFFLAAALSVSGYTAKTSFGFLLY